MSLYVRGKEGQLIQVHDVSPGPDLYEQEIEALVWANLEVFSGEPLFPLRRQGVLPGGGQPDILALDRLGRVVVIEIKRDIDRRQLSQALEYAGWARSTNLDEVAALYPFGVDTFFANWPKFTESATPVVINRSPLLILVARSIHPRTSSALRFLADNGVPVSVVPVSLYEDESGRRFVEVEQESEITSAGPGEKGPGTGKSQKTYMINGHVVRIMDLVEAGLLSGGTEIELASSGVVTRALITDDGNIRVGDNLYSTPSGAGTPVVGHSVDGWVSWRVPSSGNTSLADLRAKLINQTAPEEMD